MLAIILLNTLTLQIPTTKTKKKREIKFWNEWNENRKKIEQKKMDRIKPKK